MRNDELAGLIKLELINFIIETRRALKKFDGESVSREEFYNFVERFNRKFKVLKNLMEGGNE